jgi:GHMP kinases N terminal domain
MFDTLLARVDTFEAGTHFLPPLWSYLAPGSGLSSSATFEVATAVAALELFHFGIEPPFYREGDHLTDETSELRIWTEINNLIAAITH